MKNNLLLLLLAVCTVATAQNTWVQKPFYGGGTRNLASGFSIGSKAYIFVGGSDTALTADMWEYDTLTTVWTQKNDFPGGAREAAVAFAIGNKGYLGTGKDWSGNSFNDFWEYDPANDTWTQKADFAGTARYSAAGFSIGNKGYIGTGNDGAPQNDFYEYDPANDTWTMKAFFTGLERNGAFGFSIGNKGYLGGGGSYNDFYEYNPANDTWTPKADVTIYDLVYGTAFSISNIGYLLSGSSGSGSNFAAYDPATDTWVQLANLASGRNQAVGFSIGNKGYIGTGHDGNGRRRDFWQYTPCPTVPTAVITANGPTSICAGDTLVLTANSGTGYVWSANGVTTQSLAVTQSGIYSVIVSNACGTATSANLEVTVFSAATANFSLYPDSTQPLHYIAENLATGAAPLTYLWAWGDGTTDNTAYPSHTYDIAGTYTICLTVTDANGCNDTYCNDYAFKTASPIAYVQVIDGLTGIEDNALNSFKLYPNPAANIVTVELETSLASSESIYQLQDVTGKVLLSGLASGETKFSLDISTLSKGIYLLSLQNNAGRATKKIEVVK
jgi:hypothetical protein